MLLSKPVKYLFLAVFNWHLETNPSRHPAIVPTTVVTILPSLNIAVVSQLRSFYFRYPLLYQFPNLARIFGYICFLIVGGIIWLSFVKNGAYRRFELEFATNSTARMRLRTMMVYLYVAVSLCLPWVLKAVLRNTRPH